MKGGRPAAHDHPGDGTHLVEPAQLRCVATRLVVVSPQNRQHPGGKYTPGNEIPCGITTAAFQWAGGPSVLDWVSQTLAVLSMLPVARRRLSGLNATASTPLV